MPSLHAAELLSVGTELTVGETRDTNAAELARDLTLRGVVVRRMTALPDDLDAVRDAVVAGLARADLVVLTGGLGPTPDDLTREAIAAAVGETPSVDPELDAWLRGLFDRRGIAFVETNRKQAWLIPSSTAIPNPNGTAPGWWVDRPDGRVIVALPGPPREMRPMWTDWVLPRLAARGLGRRAVVSTLRLTGIGESALVARLGPLLRPGARPAVATYARADAVDIRIWAHDEPVGDAHGDATAGDAAALVAEVEAHILDELGAHVWARGQTTWPEALAEALGERGWTLSVVEVGLRGALVTLLGEGLGDRLAAARAYPARPAGPGGERSSLVELAGAARDEAGAAVGLAADAHERRGDTALSVAIRGPDGGPADHEETRLVFLGGALGRGRAAVAAAAITLGWLRGSALPPAR